MTGAVGAVKELWGEDGMRELRQRLQPDARKALCEEIILPVAWYPERHFEGCCEAVWSGLARQEAGVFEAFIRQSVDHMWGRVHRVLLSLATPHLLARRAPGLWRHDHTHGEAVVELRERDGTIRVRDYPYGPSSIMRRGQSESFRYILSHARVHDVRATQHADESGDLVVLLEWS